MSRGVRRLFPVVTLGLAAASAAFAAGYHHARPRLLQPEDAVLADVPLDAAGPAGRHQAVTDPGDAAAAGNRPGSSQAGTIGEPAPAAEIVAREAAPPADAPRPSTHGGRRILVSLAQHRLWLVDGADTLLDVPAAVGMGRDFTWQGRRWHFATPTGDRRILARAKDPVWIVPLWHYYERAAAMGLSEVVQLEPDARIVLGDSSVLTVVGNQVGRINQFGNFAPFTPGTEIIFDNRIYVPPRHTAQREVPDALGPYKLDLGGGYLIHGTHLYDEDSIGDAVSHGCVRLSNDDLRRLYPLVRTGVEVVVY